MNENNLIPRTLTPEALAAWIQRNAKERFKHEKKVFYTEEEINDKSRRSSKAGAEILALEREMATLKAAVEDGVAEEGEPVVITLRPGTKGLKSLKATRRQLDIEADRGYENILMDIFGIPDAETADMRFFTITGEEIDERRRPLSAKEKHDYIGVFMGSGARLSIDDNVLRTGS
jgi:hypothetical protein